jgi:hypothetical protein
MIHAKVKSEERFEIRPKGEAFQLQCDDCGRIIDIAIAYESTGNIGIALRPSKDSSDDAPVNMSRFVV